MLSQLVAPTILPLEAWIHNPTTCRNNKAEYRGQMFLYIVLATIPGGIIGFILDKYCEEILTKPAIIATALIVMGIILFLVEVRFCV